MLKQYLEIGKIVSTHGLKGDMKVIFWCDSADFLCRFKYLYLNEGKTKLEVLSSKPHKNVVLMKIKGFDSIERASQLISKIIYVDRNDVNLPEGEYFIQDLIGLRVFDKNTHVCYVTVTDVLKTGANDVYKVTDKNNRDYFVPVIDDVICSVDLDKDRITICPIEGIFDNEI